MAEKEKAVKPAAKKETAKKEVAQPKAEKPTETKPEVATVAPTPVAEVKEPVVKKTPVKKAAPKATGSKKQAKDEAKCALAGMTKSQIVAEYGKDGNDTGSAAVQIALLTQRINHLTEHLKEHKQDKHSRRGLMQMVGRRKGLLNYMEGRDLVAYRALKEKLGLR